MLQHVVMWKLKDQALGTDKKANAAELKERLLGLVGKVPEIRAFQVGVNVLAAPTAADVVLVSAFDDLAALNRYVNNPQHQEVVEFVKQVISERRAVDCARGPARWRRRRGRGGPSRPLGRLAGMGERAAVPRPPRGQHRCGDRRRVASSQWRPRRLLVTPPRRRRRGRRR